MESNVLQCSDRAYVDKPTPDKLDEFLPWACRELQVVEKIQVVTAITADFVSQTTGKKHPTKDKHQQISSRKLSASLLKAQRNPSESVVAVDNKFLTVTALYDTNGNLVHLKFDKISVIYRQFFKIISLVMKYHVHLYAITIKRGMNYGIIHELKNLLTNAITEVCLDGTCVPGGHYDMLLKTQNQLKNLSLARCNIDDQEIKRIAEKLIHPLPASKTLMTLNLATNRITDAGAKDLSKALRSNRCLMYLNVSDNRIMDNGCIAILNSLEEFILTDDEILETRYSYLLSLKEKLQAQKENMEEEKNNIIMPRKKIPKIQPTTVSAKKTKAEKPIAIKEDYNFIHPFSRNNTYNRDADICCYGNNQLAYLNIAYNNITLFSMKKLLNVINYQKISDRKPRGLINVVVVGNYIPKSCSVLEEINTMLTEFLDEFWKNAKISKKKPHPG